MQKIPDSLLQKLNKLKALEEGARSVGSLAEAENAAAKYQAILLEYNLTDADVLNSAIDHKARILQDEFDVTGQFAWQASFWVDKLIHAIARNSFCRAITSHNSKRVYVIGEKEHVALVFYFTEQLIEKIKIAYRLSWKSYEGKENMKLYRRGFLIGAVDAIAVRLAKEKAEAVKKAQEANPGLALVLVSKKDLINKVTEELHPNLRTGRRGFSSSLSGYASGHAAGSGMTLNKGLGKGSGGQKYLE